MHNGLNEFSFLRSKLLFMAFFNFLPNIVRCRITFETIFERQDMGNRKLCRDYRYTCNLHAPGLVPAAISQLEKGFFFFKRSRKNKKNWVTPPQKPTDYITCTTETESGNFRR